MSREAFIVEGTSHHALRALNYTPAVDALRLRSRDALRSISIGSAASELGLGYSSVFARIDADQEHAVELLSQKDMFGVEPSGRWIRRDSMAKPERHEVRRWQILIAGAGTLGENELYGRSILADSRLAGKYVGQDTLVIGFDPPGSDINLYAYAFLTSPSGVKALRSTSYGTKILRIRKSMLRDLPIPLAEEATIARVAALVRSAVLGREQYAEGLARARQIVEGLPEMQEAHEVCGNRRARCITWSGHLPTLSAWNYASTGGALATLSKKWKARLGDVVPSGGLFNGPRFARVPVANPHGIEFMSQRDVFLIKPVPRRIAHPGFGEAKLFVPAGSLLVAGHGTLGEGEIFGRCAYITDRLSKSAFTQDLLRVQPSKSASALVYAFLSSSVGFRLLRSCAVGTKILSMRPDLLRALPLPELPRAKENDVQRAIASSEASRARADVAEAEAVRIIEKEVLPQWLA